MKAASVLALVLMVAGIWGLVYDRSLFSPSPAVIGAQIAAAALMLWARVTFGRRSFHAAANATEGALVTTGPYRLIRHPIYTAVVLFTVAGALGNLSRVSGGLASLVFVGALVRMLAEERYLRNKYPEYETYAARTKRMLPYVF